MNQPTLMDLAVPPDNEPVDGATSETGNCVLQAATRLVARTFYDARYSDGRGVRVYDEFERINATYFVGAVPWPLIAWALTPHGRCLGWTRAAADVPPIINLHPSLLGGTEKENPWDINPAWLGWRYALDVLLHECMHAHINCRLGGHSGPTSHNCPEWIAEVNRIAPLLDLAVTAAMSRTKRVRDADGQSRVTRVSDSSVPFWAIATFPKGVRCALGSAADYYSGCDTQLDVTEPALAVEKHASQVPR